MKTFKTFSDLRQAFTHGERWTVDPSRLERLTTAGLISDESAETFQQQGAVGGHLEIIQREKGYKGFSQKQVSSIIQETNPERYSSFEGV